MVKNKVTELQFESEEVTLCRQSEYYRSALLNPESDTCLQLWVELVFLLSLRKLQTSSFKETAEITSPNFATLQKHKDIRLRLKSQRMLHQHACERIKTISPALCS